jgi:hypothetical protein
VKSVPSLSHTHEENKNTDEFVLEDETEGGASDIRSLLMGGYSIEQALDILRWEGGSGSSVSSAVTPIQSSVSSSNCDVTTPEQRWSQPVVDAAQKSWVGDNAYYNLHCSI